MLTGSRGFAVAYPLALGHREAEAERLPRDGKRLEAVTQLQPHFITPWIFQSWNIAYNVSVEMQGSGDMYFYIARGIELLAEGERRKAAQGSRRRTQIGSPDMRYQIAFYYQNKFGVSDTVEVLRCLFQLSCIPPDERNPDTCWTRATKARWISRSSRSSARSTRTWSGGSAAKIARRRGRSADPSSRSRSAQVPHPGGRSFSSCGTTGTSPRRYKNATGTRRPGEAVPGPAAEVHRGTGRVQPRDRRPRTTSPPSRRPARGIVYSCVPLPPNPAT